MRLQVWAARAGSRWEWGISNAPSSWGRLGTFHAPNADRPSTCGIPCGLVFCCAWTLPRPEPPAKQGRDRFERAQLSPPHTPTPHAHRWDKMQKGTGGEFHGGPSTAAQGGAEHTLCILSSTRHPPRGRGPKSSGNTMGLSMMMPTTADSENTRRMIPRYRIDTINTQTARPSRANSERRSPVPLGWVDENGPSRNRREDRGRRECPSASTGRSSIPS